MDTITLLARLRRLEVDQQRRALAGAIARESAAEATLAAAVAAPAREAATDLTGAFAAWLPRARAAIAAGRADTAAAAEASQAERKELVQRQAALKAIETVAEQKAKAERKKGNKKRLGGG